MGLHFKPRVEGILQDAGSTLDCRCQESKEKLKICHTAADTEETLTKCSVVSGLRPGMERGLMEKQIKYKLKFSS